MGLSHCLPLPALCGGLAFDLELWVYGLRFGVRGLGQGSALAFTNDTADSMGKRTGNQKGINQEEYDPWLEISLAQTSWRCVPVLPRFAKWVLEGSRLLNLQPKPKP